MLYSLVGTQQIITWIENNLQKYKRVSQNKYIENEYIHPKFQIKIYKSRMIIIDGNIKDRVYQRLVLESDETNVIGCDEVGVGDFFGPTVYTAVKISKESLDKISSSYLPIKDSKKLKEKEIKKIFENLKNTVDYVSKIVYDKEVGNLNSIEQKVINHNLNVKQINLGEVKNIVIDLFTTEKSFYKYSKQLDINWPSNLVLETQADSKYLSVAIASIFARAIFLEEMNKLNEKYNIIFPLGAVNVKETGKKFIEKHSKDELKKFAKTTFKTFDEL